MKTLALATFAALALVTIGCSGDMGCEDICKQQNTCTGATMRTCTSFCGQISSLDSAGNCGSQYDEYRTCESTIVICSPAQASCQSARTAWTTCAGAYCAAHPMDMACASGTPSLD